jgi:tyrosyl-tRNA synthetase
MPGFLDELKWRGLFHQATDEAGLAQWLSDPEGSPRRAYVGFDPTADSLTIGNLVTMMMLVHFQRAGHQPVVVMGGGTGLIGDPSGKSAERQLMTAEMVASNVEKQRSIFANVWRGAGLEAAPRIVNNLDWLGKLGFLEALRDIGKHFSVNMMIQKDSVRERLHARDQGISYTEFSYMILQAYDFLHLFEHEKVSLQMGGSDQWGNIVAGTDLIRRVAAHDSLPEPRAYGVTAPLVTKSDGGKFGKTESGAIWLTPERTSAYAYYQFWLNAADADVIRYLRIFTLLSRQQIDELEAAHQKDPAAREPHRALAREATTLLHGKDAADHAERAARALFTGEIAGLPAALLDEVLASAPSSQHDKSLLSGEGLPLLDLLPQTTLAKSKSEARELLSSGSITVNGQKPREGNRLTAADLLHGRLIALRRGKKTWHVTRWA